MYVYIVLPFYSCRRQDGSHSAPWLRGILGGGGDSKCGAALPLSGGADGGDVVAGGQRSLADVL